MKDSNLYPTETSPRAYLGCSGRCAVAIGVDAGCLTTVIRFVCLFVAVGMHVAVIRKLPPLLLLPGRIRVGFKLGVLILLGVSEFIQSEELGATTRTAISAATTVGSAITMATVSISLREASRITTDIAPAVPASAVVASP